MTLSNFDDTVESVDPEMCSPPPSRTDIDIDIDLTMAAPHRLLGGAPAHLVPLLQYALLIFSPAIARRLAAKYALAARGEHAFVGGVLRALRDEFAYRPMLTAEQFLTPTGFAERKLQLVTDVCRLVRDEHALLQAAEKQHSTYVVCVCVCVCV
jgi:hypothetical protein